MWRSRSPRGAASERISRAVATFGRQPDKRPSGLHVDDDGYIWLDELMAVWGKQQGFREEQVVEAITANMFHEDGQMRFGTNIFQGRFCIRVMPKRDKSRYGGNAAAWNWYPEKRGRQTQTKPQWHSGNSRWGRSEAEVRPVATPIRGHPHAEVPGIAEKVSMSLDELAKAPQNTTDVDMSLDEFAGTARIIPKNSKSLDEPAKSARNIPKVDMALDELVETEQDCHNSYESRGLPWMRKANGMRSAKQTNCSANSAHNRWSHERGWKGGKKGGRLPHEGKGKGGKSEHMSSQRHATVTGARQPANEESPHLRSYMRDGSDSDISRSPSPPAAGRVRVKKELVTKTRICNQSVRVKEELGALQSSHDSEKPPSPPGKHWSKFKDQETGQTWWFYEGPKGKWWSMGEGQDPEPYVEEDEDEDEEEEE